MYIQNMLIYDWQKLVNDVIVENYQLVLIQNDNMKLIIPVD